MTNELMKANLKALGLPADHPLSQLPADLMSSGHEFAPKMSLDQRCEIYALQLSGVSRNVLALAYGVNRRTITHICNPASSRYREVRKKKDEMGTAPFIAQYVTEEALKKVREFARHPDVNKTYKETDTPMTINNPRSVRNAGVNTLNFNLAGDAGMPKSLRVHIAWLEEGAELQGGQLAKEAGWYIRTLDPLIPGDTDSTIGYFTFDGPDDRRTSHSPIKAALREWGGQTE